jgi:hypothetical protein
VRNAICEQLLLKIKRDTLEEFFFPDIAREHAQNYDMLGVKNFQRKKVQAILPDAALE